MNKMIHLFSDIFQANNVDPERVVTIIDKYVETVNQYLELKNLESHEADFLIANELKEVSISFSNLLKYIIQVNK